MSVKTNVTVPPGMSRTGPLEPTRRLCGTSAVDRAPGAGTRVGRIGLEVVLEARVRREPADPGHDGGAVVERKTGVGRDVSVRVRRQVGDREAVRDEVGPAGQVAL